MSVKRSTPAQECLKMQLARLHAELHSLVVRRDLPCADGSEQGKILKVRKEIITCEKEIKKKEQQMKYSQKYRQKVKNNLDQLRVQCPAVAKDLPSSSPGRKPIQYHQEGLLQTIADIAMFGASAEERRRCEVVRTCRTLDDLHKALVEKGYNISRSATYLRLLPKKSNSIEGRRHVTTVPVKLKRPEADHHKAHIDQHFCVSTIKNLQTIASILGPDQVFYLSQDDKARVPIGLTAANKQSPLLMHVEYKVSLPDHDFPVASGHKLIPSVYACCVIKEDKIGEPEAVTYSGPTYIAIRCAKYCSSTTCTHFADFERLLSLEIFKNFLKDANDEIKPVIIISTDGGPDENPRFSKVISHAIKIFQKHNLDGLFLMTNAPGRSAFNPVERRMAPLSKELVGLVLPHDSYGTHLNGTKTVDLALEKQNLKKAGETLSEIWNNVVINEHKVVAEYIEPTKACLIPVEPDLNRWYIDHVRESRYLLQVCFVQYQSLNLSYISQKFTLFMTRCPFIYL